MTTEARQRAANAAIQAAAFLYSIAILVPWSPVEHESATDFSWVLALHHAFIRGLHFGSEVVFTFGPWGFLFGGYHSATYAIVLAAWLFLAAAFVAGIWTILRRAASPGAAALATCVVAALVVAAGRESLLLVLPILLFTTVQSSERSRWWLLVPLAIAVSLAALIKFSMFVLAVVFVALVSTEEVVRLRRPPVAFAAFAVATLGWWFAASQWAADIAPWVRYGMEFAGNYGEAMGRSEGEAYDVLIPVIMLAACVACVGYLLANRSWTALFGSAATLLFLAAVLKSGFARQDPGHTEAASGAIIIAGVILVFETWPSIRRRGAQLAVTGVVAACTLLVAAASATSAREFNPLQVVPIVDGESWSAHRGELEARFQERLAPYRDAIRDLHFTGTVDSYPYRLGAIVDRPDYSPRPVFQSYAAYTTSLARLNASHLTGASAPRWILFDIAPIDHRLPSMEDSLSWPILLERYRLAGTGENVLLLQRRDAPVPREIRAISDVAAHLGETIATPDRPLWASIDIEPTLIGRLAGIALRMPPAVLRARTADGVTRDYRLLRDVVKGGFLLSPLIETRDQFAASLNGDPLAVRRVVSFEVIESSPAWLRCYREEIRVKLSTFGS